MDPTALAQAAAACGASLDDVKQAAAIREASPMLFALVRQGAFTLAEAERMLSPAKRTFVTFFYPGSLFEERASEPVGSRDLAKLTVPKGAYAFQFFDRTDGVIELDGDLTPVMGKAKNHSPRYYPDGKVLTLAEVEAERGADSILAQNMRDNGWGCIIRTRRGTYQPLEEGDEVVPTTAARPGEGK